jgi:hypothetical protein
MVFVCSTTNLLCTSIKTVANLSSCTPPLLPLLQRIPHISGLRARRKKSDIEAASPPPRERAASWCGCCSITIVIIISGSSNGSSYILHTTEYGGTETMEPCESIMHHGHPTALLHTYLYSVHGYVHHPNERIYQLWVSWEPDAAAEKPPRLVSRTTGRALLLILLLLLLLPLSTTCCESATRPCPHAFVCR